LIAMRTLFTIDCKDYDPNLPRLARPSVRAILLRGDTVAMVYSRRHRYYKFPGGGIEPGESQLAALLREVREESGLTVLPDSVKEYGCVLRMLLSNDRQHIFTQQNYYYLCDAEPTAGRQSLDAYEAAEGYTLRWVHPLDAIEANLAATVKPFEQSMLEREAHVLAQLLEEGYFADL